jgi:hypothetical protein
MSPRCSAKKYGRFSHCDLPKPRQSGATMFQSRCSSSTTNWKEAETSIQPCSRNSSRGLRVAPAPDVQADVGQVESFGTGVAHGEQSG